jgi:hypothetical protein
VLGLRWGEGPLLVWGMCNPSTALATNKGDPSTRAVDGFSLRWGFGGRVIINACAYRATDSDELLKVSEPWGPDNAEHQQVVLSHAAKNGGAFVAAWGDALPAEYRPDAEVMVRRAELAGLQPLCLGFTKSGQPLHPLMKSYRLPFVPYRAARGDAP